MKIEKHKAKVRLGGYAEKDGVVVQAAKVVDSIGLAGNAYKASIGPDGQVEATILSDEIVQPEIMSKIQNESKKVRRICLIAGIFFLVCACLCSFTQTFLGRACFSMVYIAMAAFTLSDGIAVAIGKITKDADLSEFSKYNAARNAIFNAYEQNGEIPAFDELNAYSRFAKYCPYVRDSGLATFLVALAILMYLPFQGYLVLGFACLIFFMLYEHKYLINFWQFLTTDKPEERHYAVAVEALKCALENIKDFDMFGTVFTLKLGEEISEDVFKEMGEDDSDETGEDQDGENPVDED